MHNASEVVDQVPVELEQEKCSDCKVTFGLPPSLLEARRNHGGCIWCPNGHVIDYGPVFRVVARRVPDVLELRAEPSDAKKPGRQKGGPGRVGGGARATAGAGSKPRTP